MKKLFAIIAATALILAGCAGMGVTKKVLLADYIEVSYPNNVPGPDYKVRRVVPDDDFTIVKMTHEREETHDLVPVKTIIFDDVALAMGFEHEFVKDGDRVRFCGIMWFEPAGYEIYKNGTYEEIDSGVGVIGGQYADCNEMFNWLNEKLAE